MQFVIISGMSGAGKSRAASDLEDLGFYCVDNMPAEMIPQFAQLCLATKGRYEKVALVTDIRASMTFDSLFQSLQKQLVPRLRLPFFPLLLHFLLP